MKNTIKIQSLKNIYYFKSLVDFWLDNSPVILTSEALPIPYPQWPCLLCVSSEQVTTIFL